MLTVCALLLVLYLMRDSFADNVYSYLRRLLNDGLVDQDDSRNTRMAMMTAEIHFSYADITMKTMQVSMSATIETANAFIEIPPKPSGHINAR